MSYVLVLSGIGFAINGIQAMVGMAYVEESSLSLTGTVSGVVWIVVGFIVIILIMCV
jgi:hypothetical protein